MSVLLFAGEAYYAKGGMNDFKGSFFDVHSAMNSVEINAGDYPLWRWEWWHIIDQETLEVLAKSEYQAHGCDEDSYVPDGD